MKKPSRKTTRKKPAARGATGRPGAPGPPGIEEVWRHVDRFCRALWNKHLDAEPPNTLAEAITTLRDEDVLPAHEANMMHTIRTLRNLLVHENVVFGEHETTIAQAAWEIVRAWAGRREKALWRRTMTLCGARTG